MIIVTAASKGGNRKTATTLNLEHHLEPKTLIDLDVHQGLSNIIALRDEPRQCEHVTTQDRLIELLEQDTSDTITMIDCGGYDDDLNRLAIANADLVITPSNDDPTEQFGLIKFNEILANLDCKAHVLISGVHHSRSNFDDIDELISEQSHLERLPVVIPFSSLLPKAQFKGEALKSGTVAARFSRLAAHIKGLNHE